MAELFRRKALEKLRSPERLDRLLSVATPVSWMALIALLLVIGAAVVWGFYGRVATKVTGTGIIIRGGGLIDVPATGNGQIVFIAVEPGDEIDEGEIVATLTDPVLTKQIEGQKAKLSELENDFARSAELIEKETEDKRTALHKKRYELNQSIAILTNRIEWLRKRIEVLEGLFKKGLVTDKILADRRLERDNTTLKVALSHKSLSDVIAAEADLERDKFQRLSTARQRIEDVRRTIEELREKKREVVQVRSPLAAYVVATLVDVGNVVREGQAILSVRPLSAALHLEFYVQAFKGKRLKPGMEIQFTPSTVKREEFGYMLGKIEEVSEFPVPASAIIKVVEDRELVNTIVKRGPVLSVKGAFDRDLQTASGFKWSSWKGGRVKISTGTLGTAEVVVKEEPPVTLVVPAIKKWIGLD
jgi:HlyD family secretion protein